MKIMKWVSLVTQHYKKMHNVHAVDVFQFYNLDFLILFFADDLVPWFWFISLYMYLIFNTSLLKHSSLLITVMMLPS